MVPYLDTSCCGSVKLHPFMNIKIRNSLHTDDVCIQWSQWLLSVLVWADHLLHFTCSFGYSWSVKHPVNLSEWWCDWLWRYPLWCSSVDCTFYPGAIWLPSGFTIREYRLYKGYFFRKRRISRYIRCRADAYFPEFAV